MDYAVAFLPAAPLRATPSDRAEMVSQILFGETMEVLERREKWSLVRCSADRFEGWLDNKQLRPIGLEEYIVISAWPYRASRPLTPVSTSIGRLWVPMGSSLPAAHVFRMGRLFLQHEGDNAQTGGEPQRLARLLLHAPYLWGGKSLMGIDCSGLAQVAFSACGIQLPRNACQQARMGTLVPSTEALQPNDLCFFRNEEGRVVHVGISLGLGQIIHASGRVRIDRIDGHGIYCGEEGRYTHCLHSIRRLL
ncbi:MAG: C40 family peptidase [Bacteroidales bacterium]|nr:C40 family peptidase [Bacteroidales bacterium]